MPRGRAKSFGPAAYPGAAAGSTGTARMKVRWYKHHYENLLLAKARQENAHAEECFAGGFVGMDFGLH